MNFVVLVEQGVKVNWFIIVFNNLYNRLRDLSTPIKPGASRDNTKFGATQVVDILFWNWFLINPTLILLESNEEDVNVARPAPET